MFVRFLGLVDGRLSQAMRAIHKLAALGFAEADIPDLVEVYKTRLEKSQGEGVGRSEAAGPDKQERRQLAGWAIRTMMSMGFNETEIGALASLNPATVAHLLNPFDDRSVGHETALKLKELAQTVGAERLSLLVPRMDINVLDTCCDKGRSLDASTSPEIAKVLRILILNALILSSAPVPSVAGIHAFLAQVGDPENFVYLFGALPSDKPHRAANRGAGAASGWKPAAEAKWRLERLKLVEHEAEHLVQRFREERQRLERQLEAQRASDLPKDGNIA